MSTEDAKKDIVILAHPFKKLAVVDEMNHPDTLAIVQKVTGSVNDMRVPEDKVNELLEMLREQKLSYSFKLANIALV